MHAKQERVLFWASMLAFIALLGLPYLYVALSAGDELVFGGFLLNPIDGNSYLAKMRQGWAGSWQFTLPYSAEPGEAASIHLYYLFLGHMARWLSAPLVVVFHAARLLAAGLLFFTLYNFCTLLFEEMRTRWLALWLLSFGSGLGWLALFFNRFTPDFWVAEAYPYLAAYANAHFPLGLALQLYLLAPLHLEKKLSQQQRVKIVLAAALLSLVYPFGFAQLGAVIFASLVLKAIRRAATGIVMQRLLLVVLGGGPFALYQLWIVNTHPVLAIWNAQNFTPTPPLFDLIIAFSPVLLLAIPAAVLAWQMRKTRFDTLILWILVSVVLMYLPLNLQRRMISGLYIPLALLALFGLEQLSRKWRRWSWLGALLLIFSIPTNLFVLLSGINSAQSQDSAIYIQRSERVAFEWLSQNAPEAALVMASPESGLLLPAYSHVRVLYGHPFETVKAEEKEAKVVDFYSSSSGAADLLKEHEVEFVLYGPRESQLGDLPDLPSWQLVYEEGGMQIFAPAP